MTVATPFTRAHLGRLTDFSDTIFGQEMAVALELNTLAVALEDDVLAVALDDAELAVTVEEMEVVLVDSTLDVNLEC